MGEIVDLRNGTGRDNTKHFDVLRVWDWRSAVSKLEEGGTVSKWDCIIEDARQEH